MTAKKKRTKKVAKKKATSKVSPAVVSLMRRRDEYWAERVGVLRGEHLALVKKVDRLLDTEKNYELLRDGMTVLEADSGTFTLSSFVPLDIPKASVSSRPCQCDP